MLFTIEYHMKSGDCSTPVLTDCNEFASEKDVENRIRTLQRIYGDRVRYAKADSDVTIVAIHAK